MTNEPKRGRAAFNAGPKAKTLPRVKPHPKHGEKRNRWTYDDWIAKAGAAIERYQPRHLADLLGVLQLSYSTSLSWARGQWRRTELGEHVQSSKPQPGWLKATADVPRPKNHALHMLRYLNHPTLDAITARRSKLEAAGVGEIEALREAVDEIVGEARKAGEARRAARRREKYGHDPVPEKRLTQDERDRKRAEIKEKRAPHLASRKLRSRLRKRTHDSVATTARTRRTAKAKRKALGGTKGLAAAMLEAKRVARWQKAAAELYGVRSFKQVPLKPKEALAKVYTRNASTAPKPKRTVYVAEPTDYSLLRSNE